MLKTRLEAEIPFVDEIPIFRNCKFDVDKLLKNINKYIAHVSLLENELDHTGLKSTLNYFSSNFCAKSVPMFRAGYHQKAHCNTKKLAYTSGI